MAVIPQSHLPENRFKQAGFVCTGLNYFVPFEVNVAIHCSKRNTVTEISKPLPEKNRIVSTGEVAACGCGKVGRGKGNVKGSAECGL